MVENPAKRRKVTPKQRSKTKQASGVSKEELAALTALLPLALDPSACVSTNSDASLCRGYIEMRTHYPGMPLLLADDSDPEEDDEDEDEEGADTGTEVASGQADAEDGDAPDEAAALEEEAQTAGPADGQTVDRDTADAADKDESADVDDDGDESEGDDDDDEDDDEDGDGADDAEMDEESDGENGEELFAEHDTLDACMRRPASAEARRILDDPAPLLEHFSVMVDKIYLRERCQTLQTCIRVYGLAQMGGVDMKMAFHHKDVEGGAQHILNAWVRFVDSKQVAEELPAGGDWLPVYKSYQNPGGQALQRRLAADKDLIERVHNELIAGSTLMPSGTDKSKKQISAPELFRLMLVAVGGRASELVGKHFQPIEDAVQKLCAGDAAALAGEYDDTGPTFDDPFDKEDYAVPEEGCAQQ